MAKETAAPAPAAPIALSLVPRTAVPTRSLAAASKLAREAARAEARAARDAMAAPIVLGLADGQALTDSVTYATSSLATAAGQRAKHLVTDGLMSVGLRPSVRVSGKEGAFVWFLVTLPIKMNLAESPHIVATADAVTT